MAFHVAICCHTTLPPLRQISGPINQIQSWGNRTVISPQPANPFSKASFSRYYPRHRTLLATVICNAQPGAVEEHLTDSKVPAATQVLVTELREGEVAETESPPDPLWDWAEGPGSKVAFALLAASVPVVPLLPRFSWSAPLYFLAAALWATVVGSNRSLNMRQYQSLSFEQSLAVPLLCSVSLFGFYSVLKFFPDLDFKSLVSGYLSITGVLAISSNLSEPFGLWLPSLKTASKQVDIPEWLLSDDGRPVHVTLTSTDVLATLVGVATVVASKQAAASFTLTNVVALCIVTELLQLISLGSFKTSAAMLGGLLLYDVFWVFGSSPVFGDNVMLTVATSAAFDGPMKLIFPHWNLQSGSPYSILGLGDVAAPGLLIALMLRFDRFRAQQGQEAGGQIANRTYFHAALLSYVSGLCFTIGANAVTGTAQPALLYLVPALLGGISFTAVSRSEWGLLWNFKEEGSKPLPIGEAPNSDKKQ